MATKRVEDKGITHPDWDGHAKPAIQVSNTMPDVKVTDEQRGAARRYLARVGALDLVEALGLEEAS